MKNPTDGIFRSLVATILCNLERKDLDFDAVQFAIGNPKLLVKGIVAVVNNGCQLQIVARAEKPAPAEPTIPDPTIEKIDVKIDGRSFEQLVVAGKYGKNCVNTNMTVKNFPMGEIPAGKELVRVCFHRAFRGKDEIVAARAALKLEAVTSPAYILTVGADKPDLQKEGPIVDIDSNWSGPGGHVLCPCLWFGGRKRGLGLYWSDDDFGGFCWFLALRNIIPMPQVARTLSPLPWSPWTLGPLTPSDTPASRPGVSLFLHVIISADSK